MSFRLKITEIKNALRAGWLKATTTENSELRPDTTPSDPLVSEPRTYDGPSRPGWYVVERGNSFLKPGDPVPEAPEPKFSSWADFIAGTPQADIRNWCRSKANTANVTRLSSPPVDYRLTADDVMGVLIAAEGRCCYCGSLAVEKKPAQGPWGFMGRRIGHLEHLVPRIEGGSNKPENLAWACGWCNCWPGERTPGATDHGGIQRVEVAE